LGLEMVREHQQRRAFHNEVRAVAGLYHPGIVMVFDSGEVDERAAQASDGRIQAGSPYLAMEYASGGSLSRVRQPLPWTHLGALVLALLDALAHAHARGVVHRDLKPGNVLLCTPSDPRPGLKLSDFGIARAMDRFSQSGSIDAVMGTAHYMAPEQVEGRWRDQGPWTDLYALGCLVYRLASGRRPFEGRKRLDLLRAQLYEEAPPLSSLAEVPVAFSRWVARLLEKDPARRHQCAADAAAALVMLELPGDRVPVPADLREALAGLTADPEEPTQVRHQARVLTDTTLAEPTLLPGLGDLVTAVHERPPRLEEPTAQEMEWSSASWQVPFQSPAAEAMPATWRHSVPPEPPMQLRGAGLGLLGMRRVRLVGREAHRDALWASLRAVHQHRQPRVVVVRGMAGSGRTRLIQWLCERAGELGAATAVGSPCMPDDEEGAALGRLASRQLGCVRLARQAVIERVTAFIRPYPGTDPIELLALAELILPTVGLAEEPQGALRLESSQERYEVVRRFLGRLAVHRPVVAWLDDAHWAQDDALGLAEHLLDHRGVPVLCLLSFGDAELGELPGLARRVQSLVVRPEVVELTLEPLDAAERAALVRQLLGLEQTLAAHVEERCGGNPLFAVQLVGEWAHRGLLRSTPAGFVLTEPAREVLPLDLRSVGEEQLARVLEGLPGRALVDLERAAALGHEVVEVHWTAVCGVGRRAGSGAHRAALVDRMLARRLIEELDGGWAFRHSAFRELLQDSARRAGRWEEHHRAAAEVLIRLAEGPVSKERLGRHLVEAGRREDALDVLLEGVAERSSTGGIRVALSLLGTAEEVMRDLGLPSEDARWGRAWTLRARLLSSHGDLELAEQWARRARRAAHHHRWEEVELEATFELARVHMNRMELDEAVPKLERVRLGAIRTANQDLVGVALLAMAEVAERRHRYDRALLMARDARLAFSHRGERLLEAEALRLMGLVELRRGEVKPAMDLQLQALDTAERLGSRVGMAAAMNNYAEAVRASGDLVEADKAYRRARSLFEAVGDWRAALAVLNLGLVKLGMGRLVEARGVLEGARQLLEQQGSRHLLGSVMVCLLPAVAADEDFSHADNAWTARLAAELADGAGHEGRALACWRLARDQYAALGEADKADRVAALIEARL